jgi:N-methylhydantoinase A
LVLGYLNDDYFLGGDMNVSTKKAKEAIEQKIGIEIGQDVTEAAKAILLTANQNMVAGIKEITVDKGIDPRDYCISGGGGAFGTFAVSIAQELGIKEILLPREAGVVSSMGGLISDIRRDFSSSHFTRQDNFDISGVNNTLNSLLTDAQDFFERANISENNRDINVFTEARYPYQVWNLEVEFPFKTLNPSKVDNLTKRFHKMHTETYGFQMDESVEFHNWRVEAVGKRSHGNSNDRFSSKGGSEPKPYDNREAYFDDQLVSAEAYKPEALPGGAEIDGPCFIDSETTTIVIPPKAKLVVTDNGHFNIKTGV